MHTKKEKLLLYLEKKEKKKKCVKIGSAFFFSLSFVLHVCHHTDSLSAPPPNVSS